VNLLFIYQITHSGTGKRVEFTPDSVTISDMHDNSMIVVGEVNHQSHLYTFSKFIAKYDSDLLLTHVDDTSRLWHKRFNHLNFKYMQQLCKQDMVTTCPTYIFPKEFVKDAFLENIPKRSLRKGRPGGPPLLWSSSTVI
jgi:hypothetical protein